MANEKAKAEVKKKETEREDMESVLDDAAARQLSQEIKQGFREWEFEDKVYRSRFPSSGEENEANWAYSRAFNKALKEGLPTQNEMLEILRERGLWNSEKEKELDDARKEIQKLESLLAKKDLKDTSKSTRKLVSKLLAKRAYVFALNAEYQEYMNQTVEAKADEARIAVLVSYCTETKDGERVWESVDDYLADRNGELVGAATYQFLTMVSGIAANYLENLTEVKFLRAGKDESE